MSQTTDPRAVLAATPRRPKLKHPPRQMTAAQADGYARQAGLANVRAASLAGSAGLGDYVAQLGALSIARSIYVFTAEEIKMILGQADRVLDTDPPPEVRGCVIASKEKLIVSLLNTAKGLAETAKYEAAAPVAPEPARMPAFSPNVQIVVGPQQPIPQVAVSASMISLEKHGDPPSV